MHSIIIPVKAFGDAKLRLSRMLSSADRRKLALAMLADILRATDKWAMRGIVTSDPDAEAVAMAFGCELVHDRGRDLNGSLEIGLRWAIDLGAAKTMILPSDVPLVTRQDVTSLFSIDAEVVIARSRDEGTSSLVLSPPNAISPCFGPSSADAHIHAAIEAGVRWHSVEMESLNLDIDTPDDLRQLALSGHERDSARFARERLSRMDRDSGA